jgi:hypothetical protein
MRHNTKAVIALSFASAVLAGCANNPDARYANANGDIYAAHPGVNATVGAPLPTSRSTGLVTKGQEVRYRIKNTAGVVVSDYVHTIIPAIRPSNERPRPLGFCFNEIPITRPGYNAATGNHDGVNLLVGVTTRPAYCTGGDPYSYAQNSFSPYGPPIYNPQTGSYIGASRDFAPR